MSNERVFDEYTRTQRLIPAREEARISGHRSVDFVHLLKADASADDSLLREIVSEESWSSLTRALRDLLGRVARRLPTDHNDREPQCSDELQAIAEAFGSRLAPPNHNLERAINGLDGGNVQEGSVGWHSLLGAILDYRPHDLVPLLAQDFGLRGELLDKTVGKPSVLAPSEVESPSTGLSCFCVDLTELARQGKIPDVIGRNVEIHQLLTILSRKASNNPVLLGEAGVGKTQIVEGLARRIADGTAHSRISRKRLLRLDLSQLVAGAKYRGQFEDRLHALLSDLKSLDGQIILFVDEIHQLLGLGQSSGAMDAANILKPALARGEVSMIGATTYAEFRKLEVDPAMRRRLQPVHVCEPSEGEVQEILTRVSPTYEEHHGVTFDEGTLITLARMARRYLGDVRSPAREVGLLDELGAEASLRPEESAGPTQSVTIRDVRRVISERTGIPVARLTADNRVRLRSLSDRLERKVFGQTAVVDTVSNAIRRSLAGLSSPNRPRAVFLFAGPSGVGKTELAKAMANELYDSPDSMIRLDMSEFNAETARNRLIGSDPGFVGYEEGGRLTEAVRRRPYSLILLDEFEKAHPSVWRLFLQVLDDGRLTDAQGRTINFCETTIVITSNTGSDLLLRARAIDDLLQSDDEWPEKDRTAFIHRSAMAVTCVSPTIAAQVLGDRFTQPEETKPTDDQIVRQALLSLPKFPPELFSRVGRPLVFESLEPTSLNLILHNLAAELVTRIATHREPHFPSDAEEQANWLVPGESERGLHLKCVCPNTDRVRVDLRLEADLVSDLLMRGYDPLIGARALRNLFAEEVETQAASTLLLINSDDQAAKLHLQTSRNTRKPSRTL